MYDKRGCKLSLYYTVKDLKNKGWPDEEIDLCFRYVYDGKLNWRKIYEGYEKRGVEMKEKTDTRHLCPVCGKFEFESRNSMEICEVCNWQDDYFQFIEPDEKPCANRMSLNEARQAYKNGLQVL